MKIAFSGLGVMGAPMAGHLIAAGHMVTGHNRSAAKAEAWAQKTGGTAAATAAEAARGVDLFILCVGNDDDVREVVGAALPELAPGAVIVDHTTTSAKVAREMAERVAERGVAFLDAPVSGGAAKAASGEMTVMA
ncbi:MAG TPA: oxidoreductase, partial [Brevundimonas sp.]|nr:oxidoreductase [Brevundimonas sp.]